MGETRKYLDVKHARGLRYFIERGRMFAVGVKRDIVEGREVEMDARFEVLKKRNGNIIMLPLNDATPTKGANNSLISRRQTSTEEGETDIYHSKGFVSPSEQDLKDALARYEKNKADADHRRQMRDPLVRQAIASEQNAAAIVKAVEASAKRGGGK